MIWIRALFGMRGAIRSRRTQVPLALAAAVSIGLSAVPQQVAAATYTVEARPSWIGGQVATFPPLAGPPTYSYDYFSNDECRGKQSEANNTGGLIKNRFAFCLIIDWHNDTKDVNGQVVGTADWRETWLGYGSFTARSIQFTVTIDQVSTTGHDSVVMDTVTEDMRCQGKPASGSCLVAAAGNTALELLNGWSATFNVTSPESASNADVEKTATGVIGSRMTISAPDVVPDTEDPGWFTDLRFDSAPYMDSGHQLGAIFLDAPRPQMVFPMTGQYIPVAQHVYAALNNPSSTYPLNPAKSIPKTLHRLYSTPGRQYPDFTRQNDNTNTASAVCDAVWKGYANNGLTCDEFPFSTTLEGAAQHQYDPTKPANNFSVCPIQDAGGKIIGPSYQVPRVLDGEAFNVVVTNVSLSFAAHPVACPDPYPLPPSTSCSGPYQPGISGPGSPSSCFSFDAGWGSVSGHGLAGRMMYTFTNGATESSWAEWTPQLVPNEWYRVSAYVPDTDSNTPNAKYVVTSGDGSVTTTYVHQDRLTNVFTPLATVCSGPSGSIKVHLSDQGDAPGQYYIGADAMQFADSGSCDKPPPPVPPAQPSFHASWVSDSYQGVPLSSMTLNSQQTSDIIYVTFNNQGAGNWDSNTVLAFWSGGTNDGPPTDGSSWCHAPGVDWWSCNPGVAAWIGYATIAPGSNGTFQFQITAPQTGVPIDTTLYFRPAERLSDGSYMWINTAAGGRTYDYFSVHVNAGCAHCS